MTRKTILLSVLIAVLVLNTLIETTPSASTLDNTVYSQEEYGWTKLTLGDDPDARIRAKMVHDPFNHRVILFDGSIDPVTWEKSNDTWSFDLSTNQWTELGDVNAPPVMEFCNLVLDHSNKRLILVGGYDFPLYETNEVWFFDLQTDTWSKKIADANITLNADQAIAFDSTSGKLLGFGGYRDSGGHSDLMWEFDVQTNQFSQLTVNNAPSGRYGHGMVYSPVSGRTYLFGGKSSSILNELWEFDYSSLSWQQLDHQNAPMPRYWFSQAFDSVKQKLFVFGGRNYGETTEALNDTHVLDFTTMNWTRIETSHSPERRFSSSMVYDPESDQLILFGGTHYPSTAFYDDTWVLSVTGQNSTSESTGGVPGFQFIPLVGILFCYSINRLGKNYRRKDE